MPSVEVAVPGTVQIGESLSATVVVREWPEDVPAFVTVDWGDHMIVAPGSGLTNDGSHGFPNPTTFTGTHRYYRPGTYTISVTLRERRDPQQVTVGSTQVNVSGSIPPNRPYGVQS